MLVLFYGSSLKRMGKLEILGLRLLVGKKSVLLKLINGKGCQDEIFGKTSPPYSCATPQGSRQVLEAIGPGTPLQGFGLLRRSERQSETPPKRQLCNGHMLPVAAPLME